jgi:hypothetical protein
MKRRAIIKNIGASIFGASALPTWAYNWSKASFDGSQYADNQLIEILVDAIIPKTNSPGAKDIGAHLFIGRMLKDCHTENTQQKFDLALNNLKSASQKLFGKAIQDLPAVEVIELLKKSEDHSSISLLKSLTIQAYTNSEYYLTKHKNYQMAPGFYHGCVDV